MAEILFKNETYAIVGAAIEVYNHLGPGFLEAIYQEALELEFQTRNIPFTPQSELIIQYKGVPLQKVYVADLYVHEKIIVELKAQKCLTDIDRAQLINYLKGTGCQLGILINFGNHEKLEWKRYLRTTTPKTNS